MVDDDEVEGAGSLDPLNGGPGDDLADTAGSTGPEVLDEGVAHRRLEVGGEVAGAEVEDSLDVGVDPARVEGGDREGEVLDEPDVGIVAAEPVVAVEERGDAETGDRDPEDDGDAAQQARSEEDSESTDHDETVPLARLATWVAAVVLLLAGASALVVSRGDDGETERADVLEMAAAFIVDFASYDHERFDETLAVVEEASIGAFSSRYTTLLGGSGFVEAMQENQAAATAEIARGPLLAEFTGGEARVFAIVEQTVTSAALDGPQTSRLRIEVILVETTRGWKVVDVETT